MLWKNQIAEIYENNHWLIWQFFSSFYKMCHVFSLFSKSSSFFKKKLFILIGGSLLYNIVVVFAIHWHESAMGVHVFPILNPPPTSLPIHPSGSSQCTSPEHPVSCIILGQAICFTYDNVHVSMLYSQIIPPLPSPTESKRLFFTSVSLFSVLHIGLSLPSF